MKNREDGFLFGPAAKSNSDYYFFRTSSIICQVKPVRERERERVSVCVVKNWMREREGDEFKAE